LNSNPNLPHPMTENHLVLCEIDLPEHSQLDAEAEKRQVSVDFLASLIFATHARGEPKKLDDFTDDAIALGRIVSRNSFLMAADQYLSV